MDGLDVREAVRQRYAAAARGEGSCECHDGFGGVLYKGADEVPEAALSASLGCGVPTAVADLHEGETVLDLGSGAGADVLISARRVGPSGRAIGLDMTDEMLALARANAAAAGVENAEFLAGYLEDIPLADGSVDVVISNCVINLAADKRVVLAEAGGQVLQREEIYQRVWGYAMAHGDRSVDVFVRKVRQKLEKASPAWTYIHTHFGLGYRFEPSGR